MTFFFLTMLLGGVKGAKNASGNATDYSKSFAGYLKDLMNK